MVNGVSNEQVQEAEVWSGEAEQKMYAWYLFINIY